MWTLGLDEGLGLATNADDGFSINKWKTLDFGEINYTSKQCSQLPTTDLKVKLLECFISQATISRLGTVTQRLTEECNV